MTRAGHRIELTPKEYALLDYLASHPGRVFSRTMIVKHVWDQSFEGLTNIVDVYVRYLRKKVDEPFSLKLIHTVRGVGLLRAGRRDQRSLMNPRSLVFRLGAWYTLLLSATFILVGTALFLPCNIISDRVCVTP